MPYVVTPHAYAYKGMVDKIIFLHDQFFEPYGLRLNSLFQPDLVSIDAVTGRHRWKVFKGSNKSIDFPILFWNREVWAEEENVRHRAVQQVHAKNASTDEAEILSWFRGQSRVNFSLATNSMQGIEMLETFFHTYMKVDLSYDIQLPIFQTPLRYHLKLDDPDSLEMNVDEFVKFNLNFSATLRGDFFSYLGDYPYIKEINTVYRDVYGEVLSEANILLLPGDKP